jgi:hypothetical protein
VLHDKTATEFDAALAALGLGAAGFEPPQPNAAALESATSPTPKLKTVTRRIFLVSNMVISPS